MDSIDKLLDQVKAEYGEPAKTEGLKQQPKEREPLRQSPPKSALFMDNLLEQLKAEYEEKDQAEEQRKTKELQAEQLRQEQLQQQKREALKVQAREWLQKLDPLSSEGLWFERFAENYPSKLEAAIHYLTDSY